MKILQIIDILDVGGAERVFVNMCNLLHSNKIDVSALVFGRKGKLEGTLSKKIPRIDFKRKAKYGIGEWYALSKILRQYDILHVHMRHNFVYIKLIATIFRVNVKIILHDHSSNFDHVSIPLKSFLRPNYFIGVSKQLVEWSKNTLGVQKNKTFLLYNTVLKERIDVLAKDKEGIVVVGNIKPGKNQLFVINLMPSIHEDVTFIGKVQDLSYFQQLKDRINTLNLGNRVTFMTEIDNVQYQLPKFKLALMSSTKESGPLVLIEYLAQDLPFVSYKTGEVSNLLEKEIPEFFLSSFEESLWIKKIKEISNYKGLELSTIYEKLFSPSKYIQLCTDIYQKVVSS
ncbi:glycosyltransferase [Flavobacteriaceae bacterium S356]|uniref:Glycosyltransferase n=1 Tax=Asprobacillus argus TaxID=3076534 RepID=A0ABU3LDY9_9FLAO|nr:glycosyltransferase [Flavobacteriaceae bacterium S356]